jgi:CubicO group peptidase (beta-lactamase class C family)
MTPGFEWPEWGEWGGRPFPMINSKDWTKYILQKKMITNPGVEMVYNSGASQLLSAILQKATNGKLTDFAEKVLFKPLGITEYEWHEDSKGISIGGFGLSLKACDMLKIGILMIQNGKWNNKHIISEEWIKNSTVPKFHTYDNVGSYGYHWWIMTDEHRDLVEPHTYFAMGYGGQYIIISPEIDLVVVFTCAKYMDTFIPLKLFKKSILNYHLSIKK